jgi:addiction module HigA family antidote
MNNKYTNQYMPDYVVMPGDLLGEHIESLGMSQIDLSRRTGLTPKTVNEIIKGKAAISPETALKLERVVGHSARFWMNLEANSQEDRARLAEKRRMELEFDWLSKFPIREMVKLKWISEHKDKIAQLETLLRFFGVASPAQWNVVWENCQVAYRQSQKFEICNEAVCAWLRQGELEAQKIDCRPYNEKFFEDTLSTIRGLTQEAIPDIFAPRLIELCSFAGVAVVFIPKLPKTRVSRATRWIEGKPVIQLSLRYKTNDQFWFSFFHEAGHVLKHGRKKLFIEIEREEKMRDMCEEEKEADTFSSNYFIPPSMLRQFLRQGKPTLSSIQSFAKSVGIAPGIVVGRLQHDKCFPFSFGNKLKISYSWDRSKGNRNW